MKYKEELMNIILTKQFSINNKYYQRNVNKADARYTDFQKYGPQGGVLHSVGCNQPKASVFAKIWNDSDSDVAVHAVIQQDGTGYHCLPWNFRGIHAGGAANNTHVGVEMTEPACIKYVGGATFTCSDLEAARAHAKGCYETAVELFAQLSIEFGWDPLTDIISHAEAYKKGVGSNHGDPEHLWRQLGMSYTMDTFRKDVKALVDKDEAEAPVEENAEKAHLYRVRKSWADKGSQIGAYRILENAKKACTVGYSVYNEEGNEVYTNPANTPTVKIDYARSFDEDKAGTYIVTASDGLNLRIGASTTKTLLETMPKGSKVRNFGYHTGDWLYVISASGKKGFCHSGYLKKV